MTTADAENSHDERSQPGGLVYDGFISYSHAADDLLAPRLQASLQRFAKPWWKRRALRVFRDEASLTANPHLWSSITDALDGSGWFVLLLSPEAAESEWVNREIEYWVERKDSDRIIPVVTDGEFDWVGDHISPASTAAPPALHEAFSDEPRWLDLRFARTEEQLDLNNARFRDGVADIAAAIRGVPKDELESEEVRQHRRTKRTAWAAILALVALTMAAAGAAFLAVDRGNEASEQRVAAEQNAVEADSQRQVAEQQTAVADQLAFDARSDALAASAIAQLDVDPELALLLATVALQREPQPSALTATHQAVQRHRTLFQIEMPPGDSPLATGAVGGMSPAGDLVAVTAQGRDLEVWEVGGDKPLWTVNYSDEWSIVLSARFTDDGSGVVALVDWLDPDDPFNTGPPPTEAPIGLLVFDARTGDQVTSIPIPDCPIMLAPSPLPDYVDLSRPFPWVTAEICGFSSLQVGLLDPQSGSFTAVTEVTPDVSSGLAGLFGVPTSDLDGLYLAVGAAGPGQVIDLVTGKSVFTFPGGISTLSADGSRLLARANGVRFPLELWDLAGNEQLWAFSKPLTRVWFSSDQRMVYGTSTDGSTYVLDATTGELILRLAGQDGVPIAATMSADGSRLATFATDFTARVWDLGRMRSEGATFTTNSQPREHLPTSATVAGRVAAVWGGAPHREDALWETTVFHLDTGETLAAVVGGSPALSPDGTRLAYRVVDEVDVAAEDLNGAGEPGTYPRVGPVRIIDLTTGDLIVEIGVPCGPKFASPPSVAALAALPSGFDLLLDAEAAPLTECTARSAALEWNLEFSADGNMLAMADSHNDLMMIWDATTGEIVGHDQESAVNRRAIAFTPEGKQVAVFNDTELFKRILVYNLDPFREVESVSVGEASFGEMVITPDGSLLTAADNDGSIAVFDTATWELMESIPAHQGAVLDVAVSPDGSVVASAGADAYVRVWSLVDSSLLTEIRFDVEEIANVEFIDDIHLFVTSGFGSEAIIITLNTGELLAIAQSRLTRGFTDDECAIYELDPCPTLDDIKRGSA